MNVKLKNVKLKILLNLIESKKSTSELAENIVVHKEKAEQKYAFISRELTQLQEKNLITSSQCNYKKEPCERWKACKNNKKEKKTGPPGKCWQINDTPITFRKIFSIFNHIPPKPNEEWYLLRDQFNKSDYVQNHFLNFFLKPIKNESPYNKEDIPLLEKLEYHRYLINIYLEHKRVSEKKEELLKEVEEIIAPGLKNIAKQGKELIPSLIKSGHEESVVNLKIIKEASETLAEDITSLGKSYNDFFLNYVLYPSGEINFVTKLQSEIDKLKESEPENTLYSDLNNLITHIENLQNDLNNKIRELLKNK